MKFASVFALVFTVAELVATPAAADMPSAAPATAKAVPGRGVVVSVNKEAGSILLKHEPIPALQWPAMTMRFKARNALQLNPLKKGDTVEFTLEPSGSEYLITHIR